MRRPAKAWKWKLTEEDYGVGSMEFEGGEIEGGPLLPELEKNDTACFL